MSDPNLRETVCVECRAPVLRAALTAMRDILLDHELSTQGTYVISARGYAVPRIGRHGGGLFFVPHWMTCPAAIARRNGGEK